MRAGDTAARKRARARGSASSSSPLVPLRPREVSLVRLMRMTREEWDEYTRGSSMRRAGYEGLRRNVAVALGNRLATATEPLPDAIAALREALDDESALVREHAAWALAQRGSDSNRSARAASR